jgi:hypothetical protein
LKARGRLGNDDEATNKKEQENEMLNQNQEHKINLVRKTHNIDEIRREKVALQPKRKLLGFKAYLNRRHSGLNETLLGEPIQNSLLAVIPENASLAERQNTMNEIGATVVSMTGETIFISVISVSPDNEATQ